MPLTKQRIAIALAAALARAALAAPSDSSPAAAAAEGAPAAVPATMIDALASDLVEVFHCDFGNQTWDVNYDGWPDRWTRTTDRDHPAYVRMAIDASDDPGRGRRLAIEPNGASARAASPPIHILPKFSYTAELRLKTENVRHGKTYVRLVMLDADGEVRQIEQAGPFETDGKWIDVSIPNRKPRDQDIDRVMLYVDFERGVRGDLDATVSIADVRLFRLPSVKIHTGSAYNVYSDPKEVVVTCSLSGILERNPEIRFQLLDATNKTIGPAGVLELDGKVISEATTLASSIVDGIGGEQAGYEGQIDWRPPITDYGFYRVRVQMIGRETRQPISEQAVTIAIVPGDLEASDESEFGWSLPRADDPLSFEMLQELLPLAGVKLVKLPVWYPAGDERRGDQIVRFAEQLAARDVDVVGVLEDPSARIADPLAAGKAPPIEGLLSADPSHWVPMIDHVITKLSLGIRYWQLGADGDTSFVGYTRLFDKIFDVRNQMFRFGQDIRLGIGWRWDYPVTWDERPSWDFEQMWSDDPLDSVELDKRLGAPPPRGVERWISVAPPAEPAGAADALERHQTRVRDFVEQVIVAKVRGVDAIFVTDPFSGLADPAAGKCGVMNVDGTPGELLLPWRTCARLMGGAEYLGRLTLPGGSANWLFKRPNGQVLMVLWNERATTETLYLGEEVRVVNVWGKTREPRQVDSRQAIDVDRMPQFVVGLDEHVAQWRMAVEFEKDRVPSVFGVPHPNTLVIRNTFGQGVGGTVRLFVPAEREPMSDGPVQPSDTWRMAPSEQPIRIAAGGVAKFDFTATLVEASYGRQPVRIDFQIDADRKYKFSVWRRLEVGLGDLDLKVSTEIDDQGRLLVHQRMRALSGPASDFKCLLYAPSSRRKRTQVFQLGADVDKKTYIYQDGAAMLGSEMKLKVEELDGTRVLIDRFVVGAPSVGAPSADGAEGSGATDRADQPQAPRPGAESLAPAEPGPTPPRQTQPTPNGAGQAQQASVF